MFHAVNEAGVEHVQHNPKAHHHTCGPTSPHLWSHITTLVVPHHHTCPTSPHLWSHITTLVVSHRHTCGPTSPHLWSIDERRLEMDPRRQGVWPSLNVGHGAPAQSSSSSFRCSEVGLRETSSSFRQLCVSPQIFLCPPHPPPPPELL